MGKYAQKDKESSKKHTVVKERIDKLQLREC